MPKRYARVTQEVTMVYEFDQHANLNDAAELEMIRTRVRTDSPIGLLHKDAIIKYIEVSDTEY